MTEEPHPHLVELMNKYARDLEQISPSSSLDARIGRLVAAGTTFAMPIRRPRRVWRRPFAWAAAACFAVVAISAGIVIGMRLERSRDAATAADPGQMALASADLGMWPSDSVALTIPAEYSAQGTLVAVNPRSKSTRARYWIDVVVSNDGTVRIERIVPANGRVGQEQAGQDGVTLQMQ